MTAGIEGDAGHDEGHPDQRHPVGEVLIDEMAGVLVRRDGSLKEDGGREGGHHERQAEVDEPGHAFELTHLAADDVYHEHTLVIHLSRASVNSYARKYW